MRNPGRTATTVVGAHGRPRARRLRRRLRRRHEVDRQRLLRPPAQGRPDRHQRELRAAARAKRARRSPPSPASAPSRRSSSTRSRSTASRSTPTSTSSTASSPLQLARRLRVRVAPRRHRRAARAAVPVTRAGGPRRGAVRQDARHRASARTSSSGPRPARASTSRRSASTATRCSCRASSSTRRHSHAISAIDGPVHLLDPDLDRTDPAAVRRDASRTRSPSSPPPRSRRPQEYRDEIGAQLDQSVYLLYALLAMSVVISLFGIAN